MPFPAIADFTLSQWREPTAAERAEMRADDDLAPERAFSDAVTAGITDCQTAFESLSDQLYRGAACIPANGPALLAKIADLMIMIEEMK